MTRNREAIIRLFRVGDNRAAAFEPFQAVFPGHTAPIVRQAEDGERELIVASWGFVLPQKGKAAKRITNARNDKVSELTESPPLPDMRAAADAFRRNVRFPVRLVRCTSDSGRDMLVASISAFDPNRTKTFSSISNRAAPRIQQRKV